MTSLESNLATLIFLSIETETVLPQMIKHRCPEEQSETAKRRDEGPEVAIIDSKQRGQLGLGSQSPRLSEASFDGYWYNVDLM